MDSTGATGARFRSELVIGNIDQSQPMMLYQETWLGNLLQIPARTEIRAADALEFLNSVGIPAGPGSSLSLICGPVPFTCQTEGYYALSRVYTNSPGGGSYGVMLEAPTDIDGADEEGTVYGLQ
ncbi:MAG: hypothetical protein L6R30_27125, partial [Thermoanaerobaculia bacterium]|nr:hypothetical protein [Thermoanaerobaculia bacterium]